MSINIFFVLLLSITLNISLIGQNLTSLNGDGEILSETNQYLKRVNVDEGKVLNKNLLNSFIQLALKDKWYGEIKFWTSAQWGIKESEGYIAKQYELNGNDFTTDGFDKRPKKVTEDNIFGLKYDGSINYSNNADITAQHPMSLLVVFKENENKNNNVLIDSKGNKKHTVSIKKNKDGINELVIRTAGEVYVKGIKSGLNILYIEFNTKNSRVFTNGELAYSGVIGTSEIDGLVIGRGIVKNNTVNFDDVIYETGIINNTLSDDARINLTNLMKQVYQVQ